MRVYMPFKTENQWVVEESNLIVRFHVNLPLCIRQSTGEKSQCFGAHPYLAVGEIPRLVDDFQPK